MAVLLNDSHGAAMAEWRDVFSDNRHRKFVKECPPWRVYMVDFLPSTLFAQLRKLILWPDTQLKSLFFYPPWLRLLCCKIFVKAPHFLLRSCSYITISQSFMVIW